MCLPQNGKTPCYLPGLFARNHPEHDVLIFVTRTHLPSVLVLPTASFVCDCSGSSWNSLRTPLHSQFEISLTLPDLHLLEGNSHLSKLNPWGFLGSSWSILHPWTQLSLQGFLDFWGTRQSAEQSSWPCRTGFEPMCSPTGTHLFFELGLGWTDGWLNTHFGSHSKLQRWYITIPSLDQWCTTIKNHRYQWLPSTILFNGDGNFENHWKFAMVAKRVCWKSNKHNNQL